MKVRTYTLFLLLFSVSFNAFSQKAETSNQYLLSINTLKKKPPSFGRDTTLIEAYFTYFLKVDNPYGNEKILAEFEHLSNTTDWLRGKGLFKVLYGNRLHFMGKNVESVGQLLEGEKILEKTNDTESQCFALRRIVSVIGYSTSNIEIEKYIVKSISVARKSNNVYTISSALNAAGDFYMQKKLWAKAIHYFVENEKNLQKLSLKEQKQAHIINEKQITQLNLGMSLLKIGNETEGKQKIDKALKRLTLTRTGSLLTHIFVRKDLAEHYLEKGKLNDAEKYLKEIAKLPKIEGRIDWNNINRFQLEKIYFEIEKTRGNYLKAIKHLENYQSYKDSVLKYETQNKTEGVRSQLKLRQETEKREQIEIKALTEQNEKQKIVQWLSLLVGLLSITALLYILRTNSILKKKNQQLTAKNAEISSALLQGQTIERQRVAADLHDNLGSTMSSLIYTVNAIDIQKLDDDEKYVYQNLKQMLDTAYNEIRLLSHNLLPEEFEKQGLAEALKHFVRKINQTKAIQFDLSIDPKLERLPPKIEFELYSICLELINNILKHSKATKATIELNKNTPPLDGTTRGIRGLDLTISDNGIGFFENDSDGKGIKNVRARVESLNGTWKIKSSENQGITNTISIPL